VASDFAVPTFGSEGFKDRTVPPTELLKPMSTL
jgi:hypothetical protein